VSYDEREQDGPVAEYDADFLDEDELEGDDGSADAIDENSALQSAEELASRVRRLVELRNERDTTKVAADNAKRAFESYQAEFFEEYQRSPLKGSIKVDLAGDYGTVQIVPRETKYGRILDRDKAEAFFKASGQVNEFLKEDVRMGRLHELVREHLEQKKPLPDGIDFYTKQYFTVTFKD
jgi:hypothetical protein